MLAKILFFSLISLSLYANTYLKEHYYIQNDEIKLSSLIPHIKNDSQLYSITQGRYTRRVKSKELIKMLKQHGYSDYLAKSRYIKFTKQSPIDTKKIQQALKKIYSKKYQEIKIRSIEVHPRGYLKTIPSQYRVKLQSKSHLKNRGTLSIKSSSKKQIFFDYKIDATVTVFKARQNIKRNVELSHLNAVKKSIILDKFRAMPIQKVQNAGLQSKHNIKKETILTTRDVQALQLIKRGSMVNIMLKSRNMAISFSAQALQNGVLGDVIKVKKNNNKIIKIKVIARNRGEVL
jgi:flagella basal body P-ring formation protein FlgA